MAEPTLAKPAFTITGNPMADRLLGMAVIAASTAATGYLVGLLNRYGINDPDLWLYVNAAMVSGALAVVTAGWRLVTAWRSDKALVAAQAVGVTAGINLVVTGNAIMVPAVVPGTVTPKPVTPEAAAAIVKDFTTAPVLMRADALPQSTSLAPADRG